MNPSSSSSRRLLLLSRRRHSRSSSSSCRQGRRCLFIADRLQGGGHHDRISGPRFLLRANANTVALTRATATRSFSSSSSSSEGITNNSSNETPYPRLFTPLHLKDCDVLLPNRVLMGSMHTGLEGLSLPGWAAPLLGGKPSSKTNSLDRLAAYAHERAEGGVGLMVTGGIAPDRKGWTGPFSSLLASKSQVDAHRAVTDAVHDVKIPLLLRSTTTTTTGAETESEVPARICLQILHTGRYAYHPFAVSASKTKSPISPFPAKELSLRQIQQTKEAFVRTAVLARQAGYDGVEIMGSEGYLLSQFLAPRTNHRTDRYGSASLEDRARLALEIVEETRTAVGRDFIVVFRLSLLDLVENGLSFDESVQIAQWLEAAGVSIINTGIGWHEARVPTIATNVPRGAFAFPTERLLESNAVSVPLVATNRFNSPETVEALLAEHPDRDLMVSMARPFLADPEWISKSRDGRSDEINTCIACNQACLDHVFVGKVASCLVNPRACHETELPRPSPENLVAAGAEPLKLAVVGSGPAGCAFAVTAAQQGHDVTLYDKSSELGGQFNMAKRIPGKEEFHETLRYFRTLLQKHGVKIRLETEMTPSEMRSMTERGDVDRWIVATGVDPRDPGIPGQDHPSVLSYVDVLRRKVPVGRRVAVIGAGGIGFDVSEYLLHHSGGPDKTADEVSKDDFYHEWGIDSTLQVRGGLVQSPEKPAPPDRQIYLLQRKTTKVGAGLGKTTGWIHRATLNNSGAVEMIKGVKKYDKIDENGHLHIIAEDGTPRVLEVDNVVVCAGQVEHRDLEEEAATVDALKDKVYTIGGAYKAGELDAKRAIDMGTRLALKIHDPSVVPGRHVFSAEPGIEESMFQLLKRFM